MGVVILMNDHYQAKVLNSSIYVIKLAKTKETIIVGTLNPRMVPLTGH